MPSEDDRSRQWDRAYAEHMAALLSQVFPLDQAARRRQSAAMRALARSWRLLAADLETVPRWARFAAVIAAEEFDRRATVLDRGRA